MRVLFTNPEDRPWSDAEIATLTDLWNRGRSATEIGVALNCTKNRVVGKVSRLRKYGLITRQMTPQNPTGPRRKGRKMKTITRHRKTEDAVSEAPVRLVASSAPKPPRSVIPAPETIEVLNMRLMDMLSSHCRWPTDKDASGEARFCGNSATGRRAYCSHHAARMYARTG